MEFVGKEGSGFLVFLFVPLKRGPPSSVLPLGGGFIGVPEGVEELVEWLFLPKKTKKLNFKTGASCFCGIG